MREHVLSQVNIDHDLPVVKKLGGNFSLNDAHSPQTLPKRIGLHQKSGAIRKNPFRRMRILARG